MTDYEFLAVVATTHKDPIVRADARRALELGASLATGPVPGVPTIEENRENVAN